jgi:hypothetical protein
VEQVQLPDTDSPEVMQQAIAMHLTKIVWEHYSRTIHADEMETQLIQLYERVYGSVAKAHGK